MIEPLSPSILLIFKYSIYIGSNTQKPELIRFDSSATNNSANEAVDCDHIYSFGILFVVALAR